jgi:hypothetical protein
LIFSFDLVLISFSSVKIAYNVLPVSEVADPNELSILCQDKTFFVKIKLHFTENSAISLTGG